MRDLIQKFRNGVVTGLGFLAILATMPAVADIMSFTLNGSSTTNPITGIPNTIGDFNALVSNVNNEVGSYVAFNNSTAEAGEFALLNASTWLANGTVATTVTSLGPPGSHTTIQKWLVFVDNTGNPRYVPAY